MCAGAAYLESPMLSRSRAELTLMKGHLKRVGGADLDERSFDDVWAELTLMKGHLRTCARSLPW